MLIQPVSIDELGQFWRREYATLIDDALQYSDQASDNLSNVIERVWTGDAILLSVVKDDRIIACGLIEHVDHKSGTYTNMWTMAGHSMDAWLEDYLAYVTEYARERGHQGIMCGGRVGWERILKHYGFEVRSVILRKEL